MKRTYQTRSPEETMRLAAKLASAWVAVRPGHSTGRDEPRSALGGRAVVVALEGKLGAGKTVFVKGMAKGLGIKHLVQSPTFILMQVYPIKQGTLKKLVHVDCYRLESVGEFLNIGLDEYLRDRDTLVVIEWADKVRNILPPNIITVKLSATGNTQRRISISDHVFEFLKKRK